MREFLDWYERPETKQLYTSANAAVKATIAGLSLKQRRRCSKHTHAEARVNFKFYFLFSLPQN